MKKKEEIDTNDSLELEWVFGMNKDIFGGVHHLGSDTRKDIFYVAGHIGVIYDFANHKQRLLQGHVYGITCTCVSKNKKWIVTGDAGGKENMIVVWDSVKGIPIRTIFDPHEYGTQSVSISHDSMFIVSLSYAYLIDDESDQEYVSDTQEFKLWQWTNVKQSLFHSHTIRIEGRPHVMAAFHPANPHLIVTNSQKNVTFWSWDEENLDHYSPTISLNDFKKPLEFTQSTFIPGTRSHLAATGTKNGEIVVWQQIQSDIRKTKTIEKRALKVVQVHKQSINYLSTVGRKYIVTGGTDGFVRFFDYQLRLQAWFEEFDAGPIISVSFEEEKIVREDEDDDENEDNGKRLNTYDERIGNDFEDDEDDEDDGQDGMGKKLPKSKFKAPDFIVATSLALILYVRSESFTDYDVDNIRGMLLIQGQEGPIQSLADHPTKPYLAISGLSGHLHLWDYERKQVLSLTMFQDLLISCIAFDPKGEYLAVGCTNGVIKILEVKGLQESQTFHYSKDNIQKIEFSHDSSYFAFSDFSNCIGLFKYCHRDECDRKPIEWVYIGRIRSHKKKMIERVEKKQKKKRRRRPKKKKTEKRRRNGEEEDDDESDYDDDENDYDEFDDYEDDHQDGDDGHDDDDDDDELRIADFQFGVTPFGDVPRLLSIGEDRRLVEYDLTESTIRGGVKIKKVYKVGKDAHPTSMLWTRAQNVTVTYPSQQERRSQTQFSSSYSRDFDCLLICTDRYKFHRFVTPDTGRPTFCTNTFRCPDFGPITKMKLVSSQYKQQQKEKNYNQEQEEQEEENEKEENKEEEEEESSSSFGIRKEIEPNLLAYCTEDKFIGLIQLPLDGNPDLMMGLTAHAGDITDFTVSHDGRYIFTSGGLDHTVNQWTIHPEHLADMAQNLKPIITEEKVSGEELGNEKGGKGGKRIIVENREAESFARLISQENDDGSDGGDPTKRRNMLEEVKQYFFYAQIRSQGEVTTNERKISGEVPVSEIPSVLRALEFFATEYEIENFMNELRLMLGYDEETSSDEKEIVEFDQFVKLYVNHKPIRYFKVSAEDVVESFQKMGADSISQKINMERLLELLTQRGEKMSKEEVEKCIRSLRGKKETWAKFARKKGNEISPNEFITEVLKLKKEKSVNYY